MRAFICHTKRDRSKVSRRFAIQLATFLQERGVATTLDESSFKYAEPIVATAHRRIHTADRFVFVASPTALTSEFVREELNHARHRASTMNPRPYFLVVNIGKSWDYLPKDLRIHRGIQVSPSDWLGAFYDVFFALHAMPPSFLAHEQGSGTGKSDIALLERLQEIRIENLRGDSRIHVARTIRNLGQVSLRNTNLMRVWADHGYGRRALPITRFTARLDTGEKLRVTRRLDFYRGKRTWTFTARLPTPLRTGRTTRVLTTYSCARAFDLARGDSYYVDCDDRGYGLLRMFLAMPRDWPGKRPFVVETKLNGHRNRLAAATPSANTFAYSRLHARLGWRYEFVIPGYARHAGGQ
jgi:hypothetical protein